MKLWEKATLENGSFFAPLLSRLRRRFAPLRGALEAPAAPLGCAARTPCEHRKIADFSRPPTRTRTARPIGHGPDGDVAAS